MSADARGTLNDRASLIAAYCDGLGLAALGATTDPAEVQIAAFGCANFSAASDGARARWWCRASEAERVAAAATAQLQRRQSQDAAPNAPDMLNLAAQAVIAAARRLRVALYTDEEISQQATDVIARVDEQLERLRRTGGLKAINRSYRSFRMQASARGEKVTTYAQWINKYRHNLVRQIAAALR